MNPNHRNIELADKIQDLIEQLRKRVDSATIFSSQLQLHSETLKRLKEFLVRTDHTISFIGPIGVGKTTIICRLLHLVHDSKPLLDVGSGRTTISEVHIVSGHDYGIAIDPLPDSEVGRYVDEFADYLLALARTDNRSSSRLGDSRELILSTEVQRCLRNMSGLQMKNTKTEGGVISEDRALELARSLRDQDALRAEILARINMPMRHKTELICDATGEEEKKKWLKRNFSAINHGRHLEFSIPSRITVIVPYPLLDNPEYSITAVDTKGIDQVSQRADIERQLKDGRNLNIFCSSFRDAPDGGTVGVIRGAIESGIGSRLVSETCLLVLPRNDEAINVNGPDGLPVEDKELGYEMKRYEITPTMLVLGLKDYAIHFHDDKNDQEEALFSFIKDRIAELRGYYENRINEVAKTVHDLATNVADAIARAALRHVMAALQAWVKESRDGISSVMSVHKSLVGSIRDSKTHSSSVRASINRRGRWYNMDFYHQIGFDSRLQSVVSVRDQMQKFQAVTGNMLKQQELSPAHSFIKEMQHYVATSTAQFYNEMQEIGQDIFEQPMEETADWGRMVQEWGRGPGYKERIVNHTEEWFVAKQQEDRLNLFRERLRDRWLKMLTELESILKGAIPG